MSAQANESHAGTPRLLFRAPDMSTDGFHRAYGVGPDDQRFLMIRHLSAAESNLVLVVNWQEELKGKERQP